MDGLFHSIYLKDWKKQRELGNVSVLREFIPSNQHYNEEYSDFRFRWDARKISGGVMPGDGHPSKRGAEWFAKEIVKAIRDAGVLASRRLSDQK